LTADTGVQAGALRWLGWAAFLAAGLALAWHAHAQDLTASYLAGRMIGHGDAAALYRPILAAVHWRTDPVWARSVAAAGLAPDDVTSFVQTPLWAWLVAPLASAVDFATFKRIFAVFDLAAIVIIVAAAARQWAPRLWTPGWQIGLLAGLLCSTPLLWSISLGQTHPIFLCLAVLAAIRAAAGKHLSAGALLAAAAAVKITPLWLAVTWLVAGRWRPALSFAAFSVLLAGLAVACAGWPVVAAYLATVHAMSGRMLLAFNNDALAALLLGAQLNDATAFHWHPVALPRWIAALSLALLAACAAGAGWLDRRAPARPGAIPTLVAATALAPLAWNHYFIVLILPVMSLLQAWRDTGRALWLGVVVAVVALNVPPLAYGVGAPMFVVALRSHLLAALLCLLAMPFAIKKERKIVLF
jgi:hypothetical protein